MRLENAIEVKNITKKFKIFLDKGHTLKERTLFRGRRTYEERSILKNVSFDVKKGEAVGLIGHNGCGKSTTLKLLSRIMYPDSGLIKMNGRVSSLIELGAGFHPDMSGRENIYINASIFGLTRKEIDERVDDIVAFSELEEFIDNPVRTYSSGMYMRLAFSVAINVDAEILLIDEILAVGDAGFQVKCFNRLREIKASGTTIVIVSHSMGQIEQICDRSIWIHEGTILAEGKPRDVNPQYLAYIGKQRQIIAEKEEKRRKEKRQSREAAEGDKLQNKESDVQVQTKMRWGNGKVKITDVHLLDGEGKESTSFITDSPLTIKIDYKVNETVKDADFGIAIIRMDGIHCYGTNTRIDKIDKLNIEKDGSVSIEIDSMTLLQGSYLLDVAVECGMGVTVDYYREACRFEVFSSIEDVGLIRLKHRWNLKCI